MLLPQTGYERIDLIGESGTIGGRPLLRLVILDVRQALGFASKASAINEVFTCLELLRAILHVFDLRRELNYFSQSTLI